MSGLIYQSTHTGAEIDGAISKIPNLEQQINTLDADVVAHKAEEATESEYGHVRLSDLPKGKRVARFVIGTSTSGWTAADCDYLCDGTNDQEEIIQALNALPATGGEVVILDGTYNITASINIPKDNVSIRGSGNATTLKRMYNSTNTDSGPTARGLITLNEKSGCKIQGLQIDGNKATYTASYNYGISLYSSSDNTVTGNTCNNNYYGIYLYSSNNNTVTGNTCNNNSYGIRLYSSSDNTVTGNTCNNNNSYGIRLSSSSSDNTVTGNTCNNNSDYGISLYSSSDNTVTGNTCNNNYYGIYLYSSNNNTVTGNTCNNNYYGIYLYSSSDNTVTGNTCIRGTGQTSDYASDQYTIFLYGTGNDYNLISSNNCMGKAPVVEGGTGNTIIDNKWSNSSGRILESYSEKLVTLSGTATTINLSLGNVFTHTLSGNTTYSITNAVSGQAHSFTLIITQGSTVRTLTFPSSVKWQGGEIPDMTTASKTYVLTFMTVDGGTTWLGMFGGEF